MFSLEVPRHPQVQQMGNGSEKCSVRSNKKLFYIPHIHHAYSTLKIDAIP